MSYALTEAGAKEMNSLSRKLDDLNDAIDQLASDARDVADFCPEAKTLLDFAWYFTEKAAREINGHCSVHQPKGWCACCHHFDELRAKAERIGRLL